MKVTPLPIVPLVLLALVVLGTTRRAQAQAQDEKMFPLPTNSEAVDRAVSAENLRAVAAKTQDAQVLLGLTYLAQTGDPVRAELAERAVAANPEYAPIVAVLAAMMDGVDEQTVAALLERDPENALGHYLNGLLLYKADNDAEALAAFRKAAGLRELRLYLSQTSEALFAALDALGLQGRERLAALSWMALRSYNFGAIGLQPLQRTLVELPREMDNAGRREVSDMLIVFAGHLFRTNFHYRTYGRWSLESAFRLKTEVAAAAGRRSTEVRMPPEVAGIPVTHRSMASGFLVLTGQTGEGLNSALAAVRPGGVTVVVMMGLSGRDEIARQFITHGWSPDTRAAIVCGASTPDEWIWTGALAELGAPEPPDGVAGVLVIGEVVSIREALAAASERPAAADEVSYGRS